MEFGEWSVVHYWEYWQVVQLHVVVSEIVAGTLDRIIISVQIIAIIFKGK